MGSELRSGTFICSKVILFDYKYAFIRMMYAKPMHLMSSIEIGLRLSGLRGGLPLRNKEKVPIIFPGNTCGCCKVAK